MRLTQKELDLIKQFVKGVNYYLPYQKEVINFVQNYKNFLPSRKKGAFTMKAQYKGRSKPLSYVLDEVKEDD